MRLATVEIDDTMRTVARTARGVVRDVTAATGDCGLAALLPLTQRSALARELDLYPEIDITTARWLPPVPRPEHIVCVGLNFATHAVEVGTKTAAHPTLFTRFASSFVGHHDPLIRPFVSDTLDWEGELVVVIGDGGRHIAAEHAMAHVAGYSLMGENSVREFQLHSGQATAGKNFDASGSWGPWMITIDEIDDPDALEIITTVNGHRYQHGRAADLCFDAAQIIAYVSSFTTLQPGDVLALGTPPGIGHRQEPPRYLRDGDELVITIPGVMDLINTVRDENQEPTS
ncbi:fumarylacetoacetate hydrolase family protein [Gordonia rhizosphera]|uniref:Fumarylacetoacetate hydrolase family protein n=1 Tax=Gordonia rhizosphera NBRC 16068 TaxID=1108045 RepID=K6V6Z9_9ACTN|nr:fumarylacetoacetate hydrolase family protein [Gordonia rhizosphera]GAB92013.1 fumarylacetoacetate hydrolase family protein [Gordonia rhizosphera NBRC 16068]